MLMSFSLHAKKTFNYEINKVRIDQAKLAAKSRGGTNCLGPSGDGTKQVPCYHNIHSSDSSEPLLA